MSKHHRKRPNKIALYAVRNMSEKVSATFAIIRDNWRPMLRLTAYVMVPISIVQGLGVNNLFASLFNDTAFPVWSAVVAGVFTLMGVSAITALMITLLQWHDQHDDGMAGVTLTALRQPLAKAFVKCVPAWLLIAVVVVPGVMVTGAAFFFIPFLVLVFMAAILPLWLVSPVYVLEGCSFFTAVKRAFKLGYSAWGQLVGLAFIMWLTAFIMQNVVTIPWTVAGVSINTLGSEGSDYTWKVVMQIVFYVTTIVQCLFSYVGLGLFTIAFTLHYSSVASDTEQVNIEAEIENFENL